MNEIERIKDEVLKEIPTATTHIDVPAGQGKSYWLDVSHCDRFIVVEWKPNRGFGVSDISLSDVGFGDRADEIFYSVEDTVKRVVELLRQGGN